MKRADVTLNMLVRYSTKFLRNTGQYCSVPLDGKVVGFSDTVEDWILVHWNNREEAVMVSCYNLIPVNTTEITR